jgi:hypothetical protein
VNSGLVLKPHGSTGGVGDEDIAVEFVHRPQQRGLELTPPPRVRLFLDAAKLVIGESTAKVF